MSNCIILASIASRKSIAIAKSIKEVLNLKIVGVAHTIHPNVFSRYFDKVYIAKVNRDNVEWVYVLLEIAKECRCRAVLPIDFIDFYTFSKYRYLFEDLGITLISPPYESIVTASNRVKCSEVLKDVANFPKQVLVERDDDVENIYGLKPPLVVKNLGDASNPSFHLGYETAVKDALSRAPVLVQEYIEGVARGYYALVFDGVPLLEFTHQRIVEYTPIGGASLAARGIVKDPKLIEIGRRIVEKLKWSGIIMVETRYQDEAGVYYVIELNPKFWGSIDLPESLGYRFSALLVALHLYGYEYALELKKKLVIRRDSFTWLLDAFRYIPKIPRVWVKLASLYMRSPMRSDVDLTDAPRVIAQIVKAFQRFEREKSYWIKYLENSREQLRVWVNRYLSFLASSKKVLVMDFDATLVNLPVDWAKLRRTLISLGLLNPWESINRALTRYWETDRELYERFSNFVKQYELKAVNKVKPLVEPKLLNEVRSFAKICIATKQPVEVVTSALSRIGLSNAVNYVVGRDSGFGPTKKALYRRCVELCGNGEALVIDDNFEYIVEAYRMGLTPMHASSTSYSIARSYRLGIPSGEPNKLIHFVILTVKNL